MESPRTVVPSITYNDGKFSGVKPQILNVHVFFGPSMRVKVVHTETQTRVKGGVKGESMRDDSLARVLSLSLVRGSRFGDKSWTPFLESPLLWFGFQCKPACNLH